MDIYNNVNVHLSDSFEVSIIIINYNSSNFTKQCIASIIEKTIAVTYEIVVIDNHSNDNDFHELSSLKYVPHVKIFQSTSNLGFAGGNMLGINYSTPNTPFYFFLNNDCVFINDVVSILAGFLKNNPTAGIVTPQMFSPDLRKQASFGYFPSIGNIILGRRFMQFFNKEMYRSNKAEYTMPVIIPYATGSALFIRSEYFKMIGGFDTNYFLYCEEEDICKRMNKKKWSIHLVPEAKFIHFGGGSTNRNLDIDKEFYISFLYFIRKFYSYPVRLILQLLYVVKLLRKFYKNKNNLKLGIFVLQGAPMSKSLKHRYGAS